MPYEETYDDQEKRVLREFDDYTAANPIQDVSSTTSRFGGTAAPEEKSQRVDSASKFGGTAAELPATINNIKKWSLQGVVGSEVDFKEGADFTTRFDLSFADTDEEKSAKFSKHHPEGSLKRVTVPELRESFLMFKNNIEDPKEVWKTVEDEGISFADVADVAGGAPEFLGGSAVFALPVVREAGILKTVLMTALGTAGGHVTKEGIEEFRGDQMQPWSEVLYDASKKAAVAGATTGALTGVAKVVSGVKGGGFLDTPDSTRHILEQIEKVPELSKFTPMAVAQPERKIISRLTAQAVSTSKHGQKFIADAEDAAVSEFRKLIGPAEYMKMGKELRDTIGKVYGKGKAVLMAKIARTPLEKTGKAATQGLKDDFVQNSSKLNSELYSKVDTAAEQQRPSFDLTETIEFAKTLKKGLLGEAEKVAPPKRSFKGRKVGMEAPDAKPVVVDVSYAPRQELLKVVNDISKLDPTQTDYKVIKELRTRLFNSIDNQPWQWDGNKYQAQQMWNKLSSTISNPTNNATEFTKALKAANAHNKLRAGVLNDDYVQKVIKTSKPVDIAKTLASEGGFTENIEFALKTYAPDKLKVVKDGMRYHWLTSSPGKAVETIQKRKQLDNLGFRRVVSKDEEQSLLAVAKSLDKLNSSRISTVFKKQATGGKVVKELIKDQDPEGMKELVTQLGGKNSSSTELLRVGILEDLLNESTEQTARNTLKINSKKFAAKWAEYNRNGVLDEVFDEKTRDTLGGIEIFSKMWEKSVDPGVSLEAAQLISLLKTPSTFLKGTHGLAMNEMFSWVLLSPKTRKYLAGTGAKPIRGTQMKLMSLALENMYSRMDASNKITALDEEEF